MSLVIVGSVALDSVETPFGKTERALGGSAVFASVAAKNFCKTQIVGVVGDDFPEEHIDFLRENDICLKGLTKQAGKTFSWSGIYNDLNRAETLETNLNVFADFDPQLCPEYQESEFLFLGNIDPVLQMNVLRQMKNPKITACDTMNFWIERKKQELLEVIENINILFINEDEIRMLTEEENIYIAAKKCKQLGPDYIIIKQGAYGSMVFGDEFLFFAPAYPLEKVIDPTGAGDSFAGGFMGYLAGSEEINEQRIREAIIYGTVTASFNVQAFSLEVLKTADPEAILARAQQIRNYVLF
jgi:sugar/nucleoside kinase (ribokinase family)